MKKFNLNQVVQILANIVIISGIVFLAIELYQNNKQLKIQSYQSWVAANLELNIATTDPVRSKILAQGYSNSTNLTEESYISFAMYHLGMMQMAQTTDYLYRSGSLDESLWKSEIDRAAGILSLPGVRQWWEAGGKTQLTPEFVELLESTSSTITIWGWDPERGFVPQDDLSQTN